MASVFNRSTSCRGLTIDDSFRREQQQRQWAKGRSTSSRRLVSSNSVSSDYSRAAGTLAPSSSSAPKGRDNVKGKGKGKGTQMLRSVVGFLSRTKMSGKTNKPSSFTMTEPASPASATSLSRTNSDSSANGVGRENDSGRVGAGGPGSASRPRVSFEAVVQTVYIEQMEEEEVRNTFYCRTEYAAFKEAYRTHRDTSRDWCRGNDVLPCNCDACQDDLVEGGRHAQHIYSSSASAPVAGSSSSSDGDDDCDSAFQAPPPPPSPYAYGHKNEAECEEGGQEHNEPPSPVGAVFQDTEESSGGCSGSSSSSSSRGSHATARKCPTSRSSGARRHSAHRRRGTWGVGSVPIASSPVGRAHKRGGSLDDWGVTSGVQDAVKCHGSMYAYQTLRLQGFSDLYIRTHFLTEG